MIDIFASAITIVMVLLNIAGSALWASRGSSGRNQVDDPRVLLAAGAYGMTSHAAVPM